MSEYRKKPIVIEAVRLPLDQTKECPLWFIQAGAEGRIWVEEGGKTRIRTLEGMMLAGVDDWIIRGVKGEIYPCKPDIFAATYEDASTPAPSSEVERAVRPWREAVERWQRCETDGNRCLADLANVWYDYVKGRAPIPEEKPSPLEAARDAVGLAKTGIELALMNNPGLKFPDAEVGSLMERALVQVTDALAHLSALSGPAKGGGKS